MKKVIIVLIAMLLLVGCGKEEQKPENDASGTGNDTTQNGDVGEDSLTGDGEVADYPFEYNDITIHMNTEAAPVIETLGEPLNYFEAASCAFQGLDKTYYYSGFELVTYPNDNVDFISSVNLLDDSVTTAKGIYLGSTLAEVIAAYGEDFTEESGFYTYTLGETELVFVVENDVVTAITYFAIVEGLH